MGGDTIDEGHLRGWIGRAEVVEDRLTAGLAERFHATLGLPRPPGEGEAAPRLIHFCLCQPAVPTDALGADGHPPTGGFLPPVPLPRRMWAGSAIDFAGDLIVGERVVRRSRIADVVVKRGRTGTLVFVTVAHEIAGERGVVVREAQDIVYRAAAAPAPAEAPAAAEPAPRGDDVASVAATPALLLRYSALTFNAHRIHYDLPYAREAEGYRGLVIHGPLQATLLLHHAARIAGAAPDGFTFRSVAPLFVPEPIELHAGGRAGQTLPLWTVAPGGPVAMRAEARWG